MNIKNAKRIFILSDTHFGARSNSIEWLDMMKDWIYSDFIPKVKSEYRPGDILIHCGDVFDNRQSVNLLVLHEGIRIFEELSKIFVDGIYVITGNHDVMKKTSNDVSSLDAIKYIPNVNIIKEPIVVEFFNSKALFMPWRTNEDEERVCLKEFEIENCEYLFCHTNIQNLRFDGSRYVEEGLSSIELQKFKRVYSGHIHWGQHKENITMVGNPYQMTRSDAGNNKGWYILDLSTNEEKFIQNKYSPKFIKIYLNKHLNSTISEIKDLCVNNRVDLYVPSNYLLKYQINPIIESLNEVTKKLEIIPYEEDITVEDQNYEGESETFNILNLCFKQVNKLSLDDTLKSRILSKIEKIYSEIIKNEI